jgi:hypothetical protein
MLSLREAFTLGYLPAAMGAYWNGVALLVRLAEQPADAQLKARLKRCEASLREQEAPVAEDLMQVAALLHKLGQPMPSLPRLAPDYSMWYGTILESAHRRMQQSSPEAATCVMAGFQLGEAWETLSMAWLTYYFLVATPEQPLLRAQATVIGRGQEKASRRTRRLVEHPLWTPPQRQALVEIEAAFAKLPNLDLDGVPPNAADEASRLRTVLSVMEVVAGQLRTFPSLLSSEARPLAPTG